MGVRALPRSSLSGWPGYDSGKRWTRTTSMGTESTRRVMRRNTFLRSYVNGDQLGEARPTSGKPCHQPWPCNHCGSLAAYRPSLPWAPCVFILRVNASPAFRAVCPFPATIVLTPNDLRVLISIFPLPTRPTTGMTATIIPNAVYDPTLLQSISPVSTNFPVSGLYPSNPRDTVHSSPTVTGMCLPSPFVPPVPMPDLDPCVSFHPCSTVYISEPPTPSSTVTIRGLSGSPNPDDNIIPNMSSLSRSPITRSTSRTYRWIEDQQHHLTSPLHDIPLGARAPLDHPCPSHMQPGTTSLSRSQNDDDGHVDGYVVPGLEVSEPSERVPVGSDATVTQVRWEST